MITYIAFLRGINVSGQKKVKMETLKQVFEALQCRDIQTYIQSGNVVFKRERTPEEELAELIGNKITETFGFSVSILIRTKEQLSGIIGKNPFSERSSDHKQVLVTFLSRPPEKPFEETALKSYNGPDEFRYSNREIYLYCPGGYGKTRLSNTYLERTLGVTATTRNWKTVLTLTAMADSSHG